MNFLTFWKAVWANSIDPDQTALNRVFIACISVAVLCGKKLIVKVFEHLDVRNSGI